jgi:uncharacterized protein (DUF1330 family)
VEGRIGEQTMAEHELPFYESTREVLADLAEDKPIVMINLLRYRDRAAYPGGSGAEPCSGREAYRRYGQVSIRLITAVGGQVIWQGSPKAVLVGAPGEQWHKALLVRYPSKRAFLEMISSPEYQAIAVHRTAALEDSRLIATVPAE